ncbi:MAG: endonuclease/exonuclease/phosphatase family protein [Flavobacteriales bacterium]|nr:endonuclease/exonuclease/phosphatase family protein [Flavobacteriales bacterium]
MNKLRSNEGDTTKPVEKARKRPSRWHVPMWWLNIAAAVVLLVTYLAPHVSPVTSWVPALLAMTFLYQIVLHVLFIVWWALFRRKRMLLSGSLLLLGYPHVADHIQLFGHSAPAEAVQGEGVKVMSYNVRLFDLYDWSRNKKTRDAIFEVFEREDPGILCIQEYFHSPDKRFFPTRQSLMGELRYKAYHEGFTNSVARYDQRFGIATFSRSPIAARGSITFPGNPFNICIWTDIVLPDDTIRVYNAHLSSYHFGDADYKFLKALDTDTDADSLKQGGERILKRLRRGFRLRADEVRRIAEHIKASPHPVLYCGDMNDVPMSYGYATLRDLLSDAFVESGSGTGGTYIGDLPSLRIDHILYGEGLHAWDFRTLPDELSDHRAITTMIGLVKE